MSVDKVEEQYPIDVPGTVGELEAVMDAVYKERGPDLGSVLLDLSEVSFIEVTTLMWIVGFLSSRAACSLSTQIRLPKEKTVRDFLCAWAFPEAVRAAVGLPFEDIVAPQDKELLEQDKKAGFDKMAYAGQVLKVDGVEQRLLSEGFFEFTTFTPRKEANPQRLAETENARWREDRILAVLNNHLLRPGNTVSSHIVHEAMMNALRHPDCRIIQTASFFDRPSHYLLKEDHLTGWRKFFTLIAKQRKESKMTPGQRVWEYIEKESPEAASAAEAGVLLRKDFGRSVLKSLNTALIDREFYKSDYFNDLTIPESARHLIRRIRYLRDLEIQRLNRYVLEAAFPESIKKASSGHLSIIYRDDGDSTIDTLQNAIMSGKQVRSISAPELKAGYLLTVENEEGQKEESSVYWSDFTPDSTTQHELVLMSALLPGVTRDVKGAGHIVHPDVEKKNALLGMPGMGLYVLTNEAVDVFNGSVSIRTKRHFLNIQAASALRQKDGIRYSVKVKKYGDWCPDFRGNMLTIRLPLGNG